MSAKEYKHPIPKSLVKTRNAFSILRAAMREYKKRKLLCHMSFEVGVSNGFYYAYVFLHVEGKAVYVDFYNNHMFRERWDELIDEMDREAERMRKEREQRKKEEMEEAV